eukprot:CAMPEP_0172423770 /NCGR_PEP_ID=MMETSP1064-20121228/17727_1 /TAXON_ID=202472 /ORGANISM="Aulacoseira subarctica , Strain CCAP 1002/5" /LENGTH=152 /DNA_ID=CAMNT_0013165303 /DNA_START=371 /DNA_END=829 /DNA_ORIENTATION=+
MEDEETQPPHGHITSVSVLRTHRKKKIATKLMKRSQLEMAQVFQAEYVSLHVRKSNRAAFHLYTHTLKYQVHDIEKGYYANGEDAYDMRCYFRNQNSSDGDKNNEGREKTKEETTASNELEVDTSEIEKSMIKVDLSSMDEKIMQQEEVVMN